MTRRKTIGGTAMSTILGRNPWSSRKRLYLELTGEMEPQADSPSMEWGRRLEPVIAEKFQAENPKLKLGDSEISVMHDKFDFITGTPDRPIYFPFSESNEQILSGLEIKTASAFQSGFGESGSDEIPEHYRIQCNHYAGLTGCDDWYLAALIGGRDYREFHLGFDEELYETCIEQAVKFWRDHVEKKVPPEQDKPDDGIKEYLAKKYPKHNDQQRQATEYEETIVGGISAAYDTMKIAEFQYELLCQRLLDSMKEEKAIVSELGKFSVIHGQRDTVDWKAVANELSIPAEVIERNTKQGNPFSYVSVPRDWAKQMKEKLENGNF
jgi:putative phage-type endonuclease